MSGTSGAGQESEVTAVGFESPSGGKHGTVKGAEVGTDQRVKGVGNAARTAKAGKRKKDRVVAEVSKTLVAGQTKTVGFASSSQMDRNPGKVRSLGQVGQVEEFDGRSSRIETGAHFPNSEWTGDEAFDGRSARIETRAHFLNSELPRHEAFDERSARIETGAHFLKSEFPPHETFDERSARIETGAHFLNSTASDALSNAPLPASPDSIAQSVPAISDSKLLYYTLVADGALSGGSELEFDGLMRTVAPAAESQAKAYAQLKPEDTTLWLLRVKAAQAESEKEIQAESDKFRAAWTQEPRKLRTKFERTLHAGTTQRKDAEDEERNRWIHELALLVEGSQTPMGELLLEEPTNVSVLGAGLRASTLRSRVRHLHRFFSWLELTKGVRFPTELSQLTDYLRVRLSEPCNRGALKNVNEAFGFYEQVTGVPAAERHTSKELYQEVYREILSSALPGKLSKQAPRMPIMLLEALERLITSSDTAVYVRETVTP